MSNIGHIGQKNVEVQDKCEGESKSSSTGSDSGSTEEEERLRRLFHACDRDGDGYVDRQDLQYMCEQLCLDDCVEDLMQQIGVDERGLVSFEEFAQCRLRLINEIEQEKLRSTDGRGAAWPVTDSDNSMALGSSQGYDSGTRDLSPEPVSLYKLLEHHNPHMLQDLMVLSSSSEVKFKQNFMETLNSLHLVALSSLKRELLDVSGQLQRLLLEKETADKHIAKFQAEKLSLQREYEDKLDQSNTCYEERIVELHCVIAELRKKLDRHQINVIREEEEVEYEDSDQNSARSNGEPSVNENNANQSEQQSLADLGEELSAELSKVVCELETAIEENRANQAAAAADTADTDSVDVDALKLCGDMSRLDFPPTSSSSPHRLTSHQLPKSPPTLPLPNSQLLETPHQNEVIDPAVSQPQMLEQQLQQLQHENQELREQIGRQETELNKLKAGSGSVREERDKLKRKVRELQTYIQSIGATSPQQSRTSTPTKTPQHSFHHESAIDKTPIAKVAGLKRLKTGVSGQVTGPEISSVGFSNAKLAEQLTQSLVESGSVQETLSSIPSSANIPQGKVQEFEIELERLQSKINHLKAQNDLLSINLEESRSLCARLTVLMGKYESNNTAMQISQAYSDQALEAAEAFNALFESQLSLLLANCRAAGLGSIADNLEGPNVEELANSLHKAQTGRKSAEHVAKQLLARLDRTNHFSNTPLSPWEDLSGTSHTASTTSSTTSNGDTEFTKLDQQKLREHLEQLKAERQEVKNTMVMLESVHLDPLDQDDSLPNPDAQRLDLENAVLMQELTAAKEEKAELKAQNYLLMNEKAGLELQLSGKESQEKAYLVQIEHLKSEVKEGKVEDGEEQPGKVSISPNLEVTPAITLEELRATSQDQPMTGDLTDALRREKKLKAQLAELMATLEKLSKNSEHRHQQSAEFVNDLKRANSALVSAYEKSKKKYMAKIKKLEDDKDALRVKLTGAPLSLDVPSSRNAPAAQHSGGSSGASPHPSPHHHHQHQQTRQPKSQQPTASHYHSSPVQHQVPYSQVSKQSYKHAQVQQYLASQQTAHQPPSLPQIPPPHGPPPPPVRQSSMVKSASVASETSL